MPDRVLKYVELLDIKHQINIDLTESQYDSDERERLKFHYYDISTQWKRSLCLGNLKVNFQANQIWTILSLVSKSNMGKRLGT